MRLLIWSIATVAVALWSLVAWAGHGLLDWSSDWAAAKGKASKQLSQQKEKVIEDKCGFSFSLSSATRRAPSLKFIPALHLPLCLSLSLSKCRTFGMKVRQLNPLVETRT